MKNGKKAQKLKKAKTFSLILLGLLIGLLFLSNNQVQKGNKALDPTQSYIQSLQDQESKSLIDSALFLNESDLMRHTHIIRFIQPNSRDLVVILGHIHGFPSKELSQHILPLISEQNAYSIFQVMNRRLKFQGIALEGCFPEMEYSLNHRPQENFLPHLKEYDPEVLRRQIKTGSLFPPSPGGKRVSLLPTLIWQYGDKMKFIPMEKENIAADAYRFKELLAKGISDKEANQQMQQAVLEKRDEYYLQVLQNSDLNIIFFPVGAQHALDLCLKLSQKPLGKNVFIAFEPLAVAAFLSPDSGSDWQKCLAADQGPH